MKTKISVLLLTLIGIAVSTPISAQQREPARFRSVREALMSSGILAGRPGPASVNWIEGGRQFSYTTRNPSNNREEIRRYDPASLSDELLFDASDLTFPGTGDAFDYDAFQWAADSGHLLFQTRFRPIYRRSGVSDFFLYSLDTGSMIPVATDARTAELSPDGARVGYERDGDLFVYDLGTETETRLTRDATDSVFNGHFDWVYEEEFGEAQAWKWSPDGRRIAFWQTDETPVPLVRLTDYDHWHPEEIDIPIPRVGDPNPRVRIGVVDAAGGDTRWLDTGEPRDDTYVPRIYWTSEPDTLALVTLNRAQNHLKLFFFDVSTGGRRLVFEEESPAWIDVYDFYAGIDDFLTFPAGLREFFWVSDRDGHQHVYRYDYSGELLNQVTEGPWTVTRVEQIDPESRTLWYTSTEDSPLERQLYAIGFDGEGKRRLTREDGQHSVDFSPNGAFYIDTWSNTETPRQVELWSTEGERLAVLEDNADTRQWLRSHAYSPLELMKVPVSDTVSIDISLIRPPDFDPSRSYPALLAIYGGPGSQQVYDAFATDGWHQYLAQQGYVVVGVNNRGTANYSRDFMEVVYGELGTWEAHDFAAVAGWLASQPWIDGGRIGIQGTSYGGYAAIYTLLAYPDVFRMGIANSAVTDWRLYDSVYTERYMGLLSQNLEGYEASSTLNKADRLESPLLLIHSALDDNVHPVNTMRLLTALASVGKDAEMRFYPPGAHGAAFDGTSYVLMTQVYTDALCRWLKPDCAVENPNR